VSARPIAIVHAYLRRVSFCARDENRCEVAAAYLHLEDNADLHKYRVGVPTEFAREMAKRLSDDDFGGFSGDPQMLVSFAPTVGSGKTQPDLAQLLAVWDASAFVEDYARDVHLCAVCDGVVDGHEDFGKPDVRHCNVEECPGAKLRAARKGAS
jgi:hypothetical protein